LNDKVDVATPANKKSVRGFMPVSGHAQVAKCWMIYIIQLDY
jgi:hypothetical protein